jgi:hypothetical protein
MSLPVTSGLVGWYKGESWNGTSWPDLSGNGNNCTEIRGTINSSGRFIYGRNSDGLRFPTAILPSTYTLFHVAMYTGANKGRIFDGVGTNWLSGFHYRKTGVAYHGAWLTQNATTAFPVSNILVSTDQKNLYRANGTNLTINSVTGSSDRLSINYGSISEYSDWAVFEVVVYNRELSLGEIESVESYLNARLGEVDLDIIRDNLGGTNPISFGDYYNKIGYLPSSGEIGYNNFKRLVEVPLPGVPVENLQVLLDATNYKSYPGSGTMWYDISGNGRNGTWSTTPTYDSNGWFYTYNTTCTGPASNSFGITDTSGYTIFITWYQYTLTSASAFKFYNTTDTTYYRGIFSHCTWINGRIYFDQGWVTNVAAPRVDVFCPNATGAWHTTAFVRDANSTTMRIYIDGSLAASGAVATTNLSLSSRAVNYVGDSTYGGGWNADLRCFVAYNRNLSASEISALHTKYIP